MMLLMMMEEEQVVVEQVVVATERIGRWEDPHPHPDHDYHRHQQRNQQPMRHLPPHLHVRVRAGVRAPKVTYPISRCVTNM
eukprot:COSAG05_NODE_2505_length_2973_cov_1.820111_2_plen_81_part_00